MHADKPNMLQLSTSKYLHVLKQIKDQLYLLYETNQHHLHTLKSKYITKKRNIHNKYQLGNEDLMAFQSGNKTPRYLCESFIIDVKRLLNMVRTVSGGHQQSYKLSRLLRV